MTLIAALVLGLALQGQDQVQDLIRRLGSDDFATREEATAELKKAGKSAREALEKAAQESDDPEVRQRAKSILEDTTPPKPRRALKPGPRPGVPGFFGSSVTVLSNNGDTTYRITPGDGSPALGFRKSASGQVKLDYVDEKGESKSAESDSLPQFLKDHHDLAEKFGISEEGISYGGSRISFKGIGIPRFRFRFPALPPQPGPNPVPPPAPVPDDEGIIVAGATLTGVDDSLRAQLDIPEGQGVVVTRVIPGSDSDLMGLRKNDILLELDGKRIGAPEAAKDSIRKEGSAVVLRKGHRMTLGQRKDY